jgi:thiol-disulfide isomerase/thioredoxin
MRTLECLSLILCLTAAAAEGPGFPETFGVGVLLGLEGQEVFVKQVLPGSPAAAQKDIHVGDRITAVAENNGPAVQIQNLRQALEALRGPKGTTVHVTIIPSGEDSSHARVVSFVRGHVEELARWGDGILLTNGTKAPDIEMVELANKGSERLSDHVGKIIVLEFWATWCGPCQPRMAQLEHYAEEYTSWRSNVVLIAASVDDSADIAAKHLIAKGWDKTHNVWVGTQAKRAHHIDGIPTVYVIDRRGRTVAVNPDDVPEVVKHEIQKEQAPGVR